MDIPRILEKTIEKHIGKQKVLLLYGTRRTGKSTLIKNLAKKYASDTLLLQGEDSQVALLLGNRSIANYSRLLNEKKIIIIDEAQAVPEIGQVLKLMIDNVPGITIIATGSSSFELAGSAGEPLVGRQLVYHLHPIAQAELSPNEDYLTTQSNLEERLVYGSYPELWHLDSLEEKEEYLRSLINAYLLKDILMYEAVKGAALLYKLLQLLAFQIGNEVSTVELAKTLQINKLTVERYLDLLSKVFIIYSLSGYSKNLRKEVSKSKKWFFYDNGIRNALINNFSQLASRDDIGKLWEQYFLSERIKYNSYRNYKPAYFFWRTYDQQEIDLLEINSKQEIMAFESKWKNEAPKIPAAFKKAYPEATFQAVHRNNYLEFIS